MGALAEVEEAADPVARDPIPSLFAHELHLQELPLLLEDPNRVFLVQDLPFERDALPDQLAHPRLDPLQVLPREGLFDDEVVVEAVLDGRADPVAGVGEQILDRCGQQVRRAVTEHVEPVGVARSQEPDLGVRSRAKTEIHFPAVHHGRHGASRRHSGKRRTRGEQGFASLGEAKSDRGVGHVFFLSRPELRRQAGSSPDVGPGSFQPAAG